MMVITPSSVGETVAIRVDSCCKFLGGHHPHPNPAADDHLGSVWRSVGSDCALGNLAVPESSWFLFGARDTKTEQKTLSFANCFHTKRGQTEALGLSEDLLVSVMANELNLFSGILFQEVGRRSKFDFVTIHGVRCVGCKNGGINEAVSLAVVPTPPTVQLGTIRLQLACGQDKQSFAPVKTSVVDLVMNAIFFSLFS